MRFMEANKMPKGYQCSTCLYSIAGEIGGCLAFPEEIPHDILTGQADHREPYPGDNGIRYKRITQKEADKLLEKLREETLSGGTE